MFDGHGPNGHMVARKVRDLLPLKLSTNWEVNNLSQNEILMRSTFSFTESMNSEDSCLLHAEEEPRTSADMVDKGQSLDMLTSLKESFCKAFRTMDKELRMQPSIDCFCSGTTAVTLVKQVCFGFITKAIRFNWFLLFLFHQGFLPLSSRVMILS